MAKWLLPLIKQSAAAAPNCCQLPYYYANYQEIANPLSNRQLSGRISQQRVSFFAGFLCWYGVGEEPKVPYMPNKILLTYRINKCAFKCQSKMALKYLLASNLLVYSLCNLSIPYPKNRDQSRLDDGYSSLFLSPANYNSFPSPSAAKSLDTVTKRPKGSTAVL